MKPTPPLWVVPLKFSVFSDNLKLSDILDEVRKIIKPFTEEDRDFAGVLWNLDYHFNNIHYGILYIIVASQTAAMLKLMDAAKVQPLEEVL